ncbi:hypothetical protein BT96DRAFT_950972 [Gymnopus androsaceus JB14]|uniref:Uncharacterized protein n=1 Tax=Gymnopus androsaceus JB14 TaxID=1447944 RepID=A0A6A4GEB7_9AGAR|nr:hypothetical protein BT96DRAFT_950972 [Gymnopus androsaceus JB14]
MKKSGTGGSLLTSVFFGTAANGLEFHFEDCNIGCIDNFVEREWNERIKKGVFRYSAPLEWMDNAEEHHQNAQKVETHDFMIQAMQEGLRNEEWKAIADHAEEQKWTDQG